jgi:hypothetical protein
VYLRTQEGTVLLLLGASEPHELCFSSWLKVDGSLPWLCIYDFGVPDRRHGAKTISVGDTAASKQAMKTLLSSILSIVVTSALRFLSSLPFRLFLSQLYHLANLPSTCRTSDSEAVMT